MMRGVGVGIRLPMPPPMQGSHVKPGNRSTAQESRRVAMKLAPAQHVHPSGFTQHHTRRWGETPMPHANRHCLDWVT